MADATMDIIIGAEVQGAVNGLKKVQTQLNQTGQQADKVTKKAGKDFTGLSRVIQDLPYGFNAISNNLTQLLPAAGAAGLAFSAIVSAITFATNGTGAWTRGLKENKEALKEEKSALDSLESAMAKDIISLQRLAQIASDTSNPYNIRINAVKKLKDEYPAYLGQLSNEEILTGNIGSAMKELNQALLAKLTLQAGEEKILKLLKQRLDLQLKLNENQDRQLNTAQFAESLKDAPANLRGLEAQMRKDLKVSIPLNAKYAESIRVIDAQIKTLFNTLRSAINLSAPLDLIDPKPIKEKATKAAKDWYDAWKKEMTRLNTGGIVLGSLQQEVQKLAGPQGKLTITPTVQVKPFFDTKGLAEQAAALAAIIKDTLVNAVAGIGETIGNLISGAANPFAALFNVIGSGIKALGKQMIEYAILQKIMLKSLATLNPFLSAAVGVALVALGSVISNMGAVKKFATGGVVTQPTLALVGEQGPERITPLGYEGRANMFTGELQTRISGQDLVILLNRTNRTLNNIN